MSWSTKTKNSLERNGFIVAKTENYNPYAGVKNDLFGIADHLATASNRAGRRRR